MSKVRDRSEDAQSGRVDAALSGVRARGGVRVEMVQQGADTIARRVGEREGFRVRFPDMGGPLEGILINTGGGMAGGDQVDIELTLKAGAQATFATQAAERIYRSLGSPVEIDIVYAETEDQVRRDLLAKWARHDELTAKMSEIIRRYGEGAAA